MEREEGAGGIRSGQVPVAREKECVANVWRVGKSLGTEYE